MLDVTGLPPGMVFDQYVKTIVGNPAATGTFQVGLSASNTAGTTNATLTITVQDVPRCGTFCDFHSLGPCPLYSARRPMIAPGGRDDVQGGRQVRRPRYQTRRMIAGAGRR